MESRVSWKFGSSELKALESGVAIVESKLSVEPGSLVGKRVGWGEIEPIGFIVDSKQYNQFSTRYVIRTLESDGIPESFEMAEKKSTFNTREAQIAAWIAKNIISAGIMSKDLPINFISEPTITVYPRTED